jgi:hypothetical protein
MFCPHHIRIPTLSENAQPELRRTVRRAPPFRMRELWNPQLAATAPVDYWVDDRVDCWAAYQAGEGHIRREAPPQPDSTFHISSGQSASTATGLRRASRRSAPHLKLTHLKLMQESFEGEAGVDSTLPGSLWFGSETRSRFGGLMRRNFSDARDVTLARDGSNRTNPGPGENQCPITGIM